MKGLGTRIWTFNNELEARNRSKHREPISRQTIPRSTAECQPMAVQAINSPNHLCCL